MRDTLLDDIRAQIYGGGDTHLLWERACVAHQRGDGTALEYLRQHSAWTMAAPAHRQQAASLVATAFTAGAAWPKALAALHPSLEPYLLRLYATRTVDNGQCEMLCEAWSIRARRLERSGEDATAAAFGHGVLKALCERRGVAYPIPRQIVFLDALQGALSRSPHGVKWSAQDWGGVHFDDSVRGRVFYLWRGSQYNEWRVEVSDWVREILDVDPRTPTADLLIADIREALLPHQERSCGWLGEILESDITHAARVIGRALHEENPSEQMETP